MTTDNAVQRTGSIPFARNPFALGRAAQHERWAITIMCQVSIVNGFWSLLWSSMLEFAVAADCAESSGEQPVAQLGVSEHPDEEWDVAGAASDLASRSSA
jgi:hypothetical protein